ncbi:LicD family protein [Holdemania massiliensis]|uniref:LicD family protein n=1 Tax=Holdemania massiliensis TaxID=1468449 RepID=UPI001F0554B9|nr:LicD family protein [Holdemania massiliensis]MCH1940958.1 LicD family protein [Holdemania massiliensis]
MLEILKEYKRVCEKHHLRYFFAFGTCLGAVRHKGFIPCDDDIDVIMPYGDYLRLQALAPTEFPKNYFLQTFGSEPECGLCDAKLRRSDTTLIAGSLANKNVHHGIYIDIYPYYNLSDGKFSKIAQYFNAMLWMLLTVGRVPQNHGGIMAKCSNLMLRIIPNSRKPSVRKKVFEAMTKYENQKTENVFFAIGNIKVMRELYKREWFSDIAQLQFEDEIFAVPIGYKEYMSNRYGQSYMQLPPETERGVKLNDIVAWSSDIPYKDYEEATRLKG